MRNAALEMALSGPIFDLRLRAPRRTDTVDSPIENVTTMARKRIYKVVFHQQGNVYELYARSVSHAEMYGFLEIGEIIFGERSAVLVDPAEEKLKSEFEGVKRTFVPIHCVVRVDEVDKEGVNKVAPSDGSESKVTPFPVPAFGAGKDSTPGSDS